MFYHSSKIAEGVADQNNGGNTMVMEDGADDAETLIFDHISRRSEDSNCIPTRSVSCPRREECWVYMLIYGQSRAAALEERTSIMDPWNDEVLLQCPQRGSLQKGSTLRGPSLASFYQNTACSILFEWNPMLWIANLITGQETLIRYNLLLDSTIAFKVAVSIWNGPVRIRERDVGPRLSFTRSHWIKSEIRNTAYIYVTRG